MNNVSLIGRIVKEPVLDKDSDVSKLKIVIAVRRGYKNNVSEYDTDFLQCILWGYKAELVCKHFDKGDRIGIVGRVQTYNYMDSVGNYKTYVYIKVDDFSFIETLKSKQTSVNPDTGEVTPADFL